VEWGKQEGRSIKKKSTEKESQQNALKMGVRTLQVVGSTSITTGLVLAFLLVHFLWVVYDQYRHPENEKAYAIAQYRIASGICGTLQHEVLSEMETICSDSRRLVATVGPFPWGYWLRVLDKTWAEHYDHLKTWWMWPLYSLAAICFHAFTANPVSFMATLTFWVSLALRLIVSFGYSSLRHASKMHRDAKRAERERQQPLQAVAFQLPSPLPKQQPVLQLEQQHDEGILTNLRNVQHMRTLFPNGYSNQNWGKSLGV